ncbi:hypothetical protein D9M68_910850 [compost metagenome]
MLVVVQLANRTFAFHVFLNGHCILDPPFHTQSLGELQLLIHPAVAPLPVVILKFLGAGDHPRLHSVFNFADGLIHL